MKDMPILKNVVIEKIDNSTKELIKDKFIFGIYSDEECAELIREVESDREKGIVEFNELRYGTYYIKEIKAPLGYKLSDQVVEIVINDEGVFADGVSLEESDSVYSFVYYNSLLPSIQTGNETNYNLIINLMILSLFGVSTSVVILRKRKNN